MIDIHSHILPGVDDGAKSLQEALDMLKMAVDTGVTTQVLTPHIRNGRFDNTKSQLEQAFLEFRDKVDRAQIDIDVILGSEVRIDSTLISMAQREDIPILGTDQNKQKVFLLEFSRNQIPSGVDNLIKWLRGHHFLPVIVHPERNKVFNERPDLLHSFVQKGCKIQITASSLTGRFKGESRIAAEDLISRGWVTAMASDCHNLKGRPPDLYEGYRQAVSLIGKTQADKLVYDGPRQLINDNPFLRK